MHPNTWNEYQLNIQCISYLLHHIHYGSMQTNLIKGVTDINSLITELNISSYIQTPWLAHHILYKPGQRRSTYKFRHQLHVPEQILSLTTIPHSSLINLAPQHLFVAYCICPKNTFSFQCKDKKQGQCTPHASCPLTEGSRLMSGSPF